MTRAGRPLCLMVVLVAMQSSVPALAADPLAARPTYTDRALSDVANAAAMTQRIWVPGLDEGYVPQGLTAIGSDLYLSAYKSIDPRQGRGPCRLYRLDVRSGVVTGQLDLPPQCGHAGGLAKGPAGRLFVSDTHEVFEIELGDDRDPVIGRVARSIELLGAVRGSFAAGTGDSLWLGTYSKASDAKLYKFPFAALKLQLSEEDAAASLPLPTLAQGAAFDAAGRLWLSRSGSRLGELLQLHPASGEVEARYLVPAGIEDLTFDASGQLWSLSEAGSRRWIGWDTFFPVVFRLDPARLR